MSKIEKLLRQAGALPVLFISDPINGDSFEFGTHEELENELEAFQESEHPPEVAAELTTANDLVDRLDFEAYEDQEPTVRR